jgi:hypothetical protein
MTKFEELQAIIERNKKKGKPAKSTDTEDDPLEVPGITESSKGGNPHMEFATDEQDPDLLDQLHMKAKTKPNDGSNAASWDATWD